MNRRYGATLAVVALSCGCATSGGRAAVTVAGVAAASVVLSAVASRGGCGENNDNDISDCLLIGASLEIVTVAALVTALVFEISGAHARSLSPTGPPGTVVPQPITSEQLEQLTLEAESAARARQCEVVAGIASRVRAADRSYYDATFLRDALVASCL